jgi:hypothetical protein
VTGAIAPVNARDFTGGASDFPVNARRVHFFLLPTARPARNVSSRRFEAKREHDISRARPGLGLEKGDRIFDAIRCASLNRAYGDAVSKKSVRSVTSGKKAPAVAGKGRRRRGSLSPSDARALTKGDAAHDERETPT